MAVPKRRQSRSRSRKRNSHNAVKPRQLMYCPQCSTATPTHVVCPNCGYYQGRTVVETEE
jgi:large subunit ribosomal protein L32